MTMWAGTTFRISRLLGTGVVAVALAATVNGVAFAQPSPTELTERLFEAVHMNDPVAVRATVAAGVDVHFQNEWGLTAADVALDKGYFPIALYLLSEEPSVGQQARDLTPLSPQPPPPPAPPLFAAPETAPPAEPIIAKAPFEAGVPARVPVADRPFLERLRGQLRRLFKMEEGGETQVAEAPPPAAAEETPPPPPAVAEETPPPPPAVAEETPPAPAPPPLAAPEAVPEVAETASAPPRPVPPPFAAPEAVPPAEPIIAKAPFEADVPAQTPVADRPFLERLRGQLLRGQLRRLLKMEEGRETRVAEAPPPAATEETPPPPAPPPLAAPEAVPEVAEEISPPVSAEMPPGRPDPWDAVAEMERELSRTVELERELEKLALGQAAAPKPSVEAGPESAPKPVPEGWTSRAVTVTEEPEAVPGPRDWASRVEEAKEPTPEPLPALEPVSTPQDKEKGFFEYLDAQINKLLPRKSSSSQVVEIPLPPADGEDPQSWAPKVVPDPAPAAPETSQRMNAAPKADEVEPPGSEGSRGFLGRVTDRSGELFTREPEPEQVAMAPPDLQAVPGPRDWEPRVEEAKEPTPEPLPAPDPTSAPQDKEKGGFEHLDAQIKNLLPRKLSPDQVAEISLPPADGEDPQSWAPKVVPDPAPVFDPGPAPAVEDVRPPEMTFLTESESKPSFLAKAKTYFRRLIGGKPEPEKAPSEAEGWTPKTVETEPSEGEPVPGEVDVAGLDPAVPENPGLMARMLSGVSSFFSGKPDKVWAPTAAEGEEATEEPEIVPADPGVEPQLAEATETSQAIPEGSDPVASLRALGIRDAAKYLSDKPYDPMAVPQVGEEAQQPPEPTTLASRFPPTTELPQDTFAPDKPIPPREGEPGRSAKVTPAPPFDARFDRGEEPAPLSLERKPAESEGGAPGEGSLFDQLGNILKPLELQPLPGEKATGAPPPPAMEQGPAELPAEPAPEQPPAQQAMALPTAPGPGQWNSPLSWAEQRPEDQRQLPDATGKPLNEVTLAVAGDMALGKRLRVEEKISGLAHGKACVSKLRGVIVFCVEPVAWSEDVASYFDVNTILYQGKHIIVRYDDGRATNMQVVFPTEGYDAVVDHFISLFGPPTDVWRRRIAPLASKRQENPTVVWRSSLVVAGRVALLEVRLFDDTRGGFPDTKHGAVLLHYSDSKPIFPRLSTLDLMIMRPRTMAGVRVRSE